MTIPLSILAVSVTGCALVGAHFFVPSPTWRKAILVASISLCGFSIMASAAFFLGVL